VVLFDELEKAHEDVLNVLLQIMDEGTLTDGKGRTVNFKNTIFAMTSNIGSREILEVARQADDTADQAELTADVVKAALEEAMKPELLNRIDEIVVFNPLSYENLKDIATNLIAGTVKRAADDQNIRMIVSDNVAEMVTREALKVAKIYGARPIRRAVQRYLEDTMAEAIMNDFVNEGDEVKIDFKDPNGDKRVVKITKMAAKHYEESSSILIDVDDDAGITSSEISDLQATNGDLPKLGDPPSPKKKNKGGPPSPEPETFQ
jgi:ATP-dependent Clp protease ATP-binding subunit ClpC